MKFPAWKESPVTQIWDMTERFRAMPNKGMDNPDDDAGVRVWLVHAPWMAPFMAWHWHYVALIHLRDLPNQSRPPTLLFEGATHELCAYAVDPDVPFDIQAEELPQLSFLAPVSIVQQFMAPSDAEALTKVERCLELTLSRNLTLEADGRRVWEHLLRECPGS